MAVRVPQGEHTWEPRLPGHGPKVFEGRQFEHEETDVAGVIANRGYPGMWDNVTLDISRLSVYEYAVAAPNGNTERP